MKNNTLICILSLILLSLPNFSLSVRCNADDKNALLQIKQALNNPYLLASWNPNTDCCTWYCVECDSKTNRITSLTIFSGEISGQIPTAVGDLPYLKTLEFRELTNLYGEIPQAISKLSQLQELRLSYTNLTGPIPSYLSQLKNLNLIELAYNDLTGSIPPSLSQLNNLNLINLEGNMLTGPIPDSFGKFSGNVPDLFLAYNSLSGSIPKSLGGLNFTTLYFQGNSFIGDLSFMFGSNKTVQIVDFSSNSFQFDLTKVVFPASLTSLDLSHNKIYGSLPEGLTSLNLQYLNVSYNQLCGKIPTGGKLQSFDATSYSPNKCLCGAPLAAC